MKRNRRFLNDCLEFRHSDLVALLRHRALVTPDACAYVFLKDGESVEHTISFGELDRRARIIAAQLQAKDMKDKRALLIFPAGIDYIAAFLGCLYAGVIAVPIYPPSRHQAQRLKAIIHDASPSVVLTTAYQCEKLSVQFADDWGCGRLTWLITDSSTSLDPDDWMPPGLQSESLAFLQYTSGSTGDPKGVMVSHGNLMANQRMIKQAFHHTRETVVVGWLPLYHDMGLIGNVLQPLYLGATAILMSPLAFLEQPVRWLRAISTYRATTSGGPNFAYELCVRKISSEQKQELDLSCWRVAFNGAEPVRSATLARFFDAFRDCGFRRTAFFPCYGLAESTLFVSGKQLSSNPPPNSEHEQAEQPNHSHKLISSGRSGKDHTVCIVNPLTNILCPDGQEGEIWVAGPSVAQGYWNRPELSAAQFRAVLALPEDRLDPNDCHERNIPQTDAAHYTHTYLRTGDLGIIEHGELFVTGRIKDLIILRGRNYYPHDLEQAIDDNVDGIRSNGCAAFSVEQAGEERLIIAVEVRRKKISAQQADELFSQIRQALNDASDAPIGELLLVPPGSILKTSSGKIQRHAIKQAYLHGHCNILARSGQNHTSAITPIADRHSPNHPFQDEWRLLSSAQRMPWMIEFLQSHLAKLLMISPISMTPERSIRTLGLDSLRLVEFKHTIDACLGTELPVAILLSEISIADLARMLVIEMSLTALPDKMPSSQKDVSLSCTQQAIWAVQQSEVDSIANNVHFSVRVDGLLDHVLLQQAVEKLLQRHPQLRTRYHDNGESVQQSVIPCAQLQSYFFSIDATNWSEAALQNDFTQRIRQHFDLAAGPLLRVACYQQSEQVHVILFCAHHVAVDLWTSMIVLHDLKVIMHNLKQGKNDDLPNVIADYQDFVAWQRHYLQSSAGHEDLMFWRQELSGDLPQLTLPIDFSRPLLSEYRGASKTFRLNRELTQQLKQLGQRYGATLFMTLLTVYKVLLHRYTHQNDMIVGTANNGRPQSRFKHVAGYFVNPIAIRTFPHGLLSFTSYLTQVRDKVMGALTHADYPFSLLVEQVQPQRSATHWPIYQTLLIVQQGPAGMDDSPAHLTFGNDGEPVNWGDWTISSKEINEHVENFDLRLMAVEDQRGLLLSFKYRTDLFEATTIARMAEHLQLLLEQIIARPDALLSELSLLTESESTRQFQISNSNSPVLSEKRCLHELFEAQVELTPKHAAVACDGKHLTYAELNRRANQLAYFLQIQGVGPETAVALCLRRSVDMIVAMLGILKAGGAYVPIDPDFPLMRIGSILDDSGARLIITQQALMDKVQIGEIPMLCLDEEQNDILAASYENPQNLGSSDHLAYLIYTSGSTGKSKGVAITHRNVVHSTLARFETYPDPIDGFLLLSSYTFDSSVAGIFWTLCQGGCIHIPVEGAEKDPQLLGKILSTEKISHLLCLPSFYAALLENLPQFLFEQMKVIVVAGEACPVDVVARHHIKLPHVAMFNEYGPTEGTVWSSVHAIQAGDVSASVPIGKPIKNVQIHLLDPYLNSVPVGIIGELYIGGTGLARGYQQAPNLTAERFIPNIFAADHEESGARVLNQAPIGSRLYRTGDLGRYRADGSIEFLGRVDHQVKIRGFRIELAEIEAKLKQHPGVKESAIAVTGNPPADQRMVAYLSVDATQLLDYVLAQDEGFDFDRLTSDLLSTLSAAGHGAVCGLQSNRYLQQFLKKSLPDYMVPSVFVLMAGLPLLPNGKLNRQALPIIDHPLSRIDRECVQPSNPIEKTLLKVWEEVLTVNQSFGIHDSFFDVGGHSMSAIRVIGRIQNEFNLLVPVARMFEMPTIAQLAQWIVQQQIDGQDREVLESLLDELEQIPDETGFIDEREIASARWFHE